MYIELTIGASSSGKTTYANDQVNKSRGTLVNINRDDIRKLLFAIRGWGEYKFTKDNESLVTHAQKLLVSSAISANKNIIISDTNLKQEYRDVFKEIAINAGYEYRETWFDVPLEELLLRNSIRDSWKLSDEMITSMYNLFVEQHDNTKNTFVFGFGVSGQIYEPRTDLPNAVIFDTDGTTAQMVNRKPYEWDKVHTDLPKYNVINHAIDLKKRGIKVINLSGRDGCCKEATRKWYDLVGMPCDDHFQRKEGDSRPDDIIKKEILFDEIAGKYNILYVVDDRQKVVDMWRSIGLECWQVSSGYF